MTLTSDAYIAVTKSTERTHVQEAVSIHVAPHYIAHGEIRCCNGHKLKKESKLRANNRSEDLGSGHFD